MKHRINLLAVTLLLFAVHLHAGTFPSEPPSIRYGDLFADRFEPRPLVLFPRIEFITDRNAVFEGSGEQQTVAVRVFDADGVLVENPDLEWSSANAGLLAVDGQADGAVLEALGSWEGPINYSVEETGLGISASGQAVMADFQPAVVRIPSQWVVAIYGDRTAEHDVTLEANPATNSIVAGDIVLSGDYAGVAIAVTGVTVNGEGQVVVTGEPAPITAVFDNYQQQVVGETLSVRVESTATRTRTTIHSVRDGALLYEQIEEGSRAAQLIECSGNLDIGANINFDALNVEWEITPISELAVSGASLESMRFGVEGSLIVDAELEVNLTAGVSLSGSCGPILPDIGLPGITTWVVDIAPIVSPEIKVSATASAGGNVGWIALSGLQRTWELESGLLYTSNDGGNLYSDHSSTGPVPQSSGVQLDSEMGLELGVLGGGDVGLEFCLGRCLGSGWTELFDLAFIKAYGGPHARLNLPAPLTPGSANYVGPGFEAGIDAQAEAGVTAEFFESGVFSYIPLSWSGGSSDSIFDENFPLIETDLTGTLACLPTCAAIPASGGTLDMGLALNSETTGTATFWLEPPGSSQLIQIATAPVANGQASLQYDTGPLSSGEYRVYGRLSPDEAAYWFAGTLPLAPMSPIGEFIAQGAAEPSACDSVQSLEQASGGVIAQATDCLNDLSGENCSSYASIFGGTPFPGTQIQQRFRLLTNTYAALEFTTPPNLNGTHTGAYTAEVYALVTSGVRLMSISDCPGDFDAGRLDSRCILSRSGPETLRWQGSDDSFRCPLEADTRYYLNVIYSNDQPGTPMDQIEWACTDPSACGNLITPIHNYP